MSKGFTTKENILKAAFELTSKFGLESLSIGELAKTVGMSKSGLFSHFKSKEKLQIMVLDYAAANFVLKVIEPALKEERGLDRLNAMMTNWQNWSTNWLPGGCPFLSSIVEFDDRPGNVQDHVRELQKTMISTFKRALDISKEEGQIKSDVDTDQVAYELYSNMIGYHIFNRLLKDDDATNRFKVNYKRIVESYKA
jgi:AcrR family transcriptional regulator